MALFSVCPWPGRNVYLYTSIYFLITLLLLLLIFQRHEGIQHIVIPKLNGSACINQEARGGLAFKNELEQNLSRNSGSLGSKSEIWKLESNGSYISYDCPRTSGDMNCTIETKTCNTKVWVDLRKQYWSLGYLSHGSNMNESRYAEFVKNLSPVDFREIVNYGNGTRHFRFLRRAWNRIEYLQSKEPFVILPSWCDYWPAASGNCEWPNYVTAFVYEERLCFWPKINTPSINLTFWKQKLSQQVNHDGRVLKANRVMVAGGFFENFWHAAVMLNSWCNVKDQEDVHFLVQTERNTPLFIEKLSKEIGITSSRIIHHEGPILADSVLLAPYYGNVDWSCLHASLSLPSRTDRNLIVVYYRPLEDFGRNIPEDIHHHLTSKLSETLDPSIHVRTFSGNETLETTKELFQRARVVIGPHGAGMVNLIFCREGTPVVEFITKDLIDRPWQMMGGQTFGLIWWPVLLRNFSSVSEILNSVAVVKEAINFSEAP